MRYVSNRYKKMLSMLYSLPWTYWYQQVQIVIETSPIETIVNLFIQNPWKCHTLEKEHTQPLGPNLDLETWVWAN